MLLGRVQEKLSQSGDGETMRDILLTGDFDAAAYNQTYAQFMQNGHKESAQHIILAAVDRFPLDAVSRFFRISFLAAARLKGLE